MSTQKDTCFGDRVGAKRRPNTCQGRGSLPAQTRAYLTPESSVLEFGCGTGSTALAHAPHVGAIMATDFSEAMIDIAERNAAAAEITNVTFRRAAVSALPTLGGPYDVVLGLGILHLLEDPAQTVRDASDLLRPGGVFISSTACIGDDMAVFKWLGPLGRALGFLPRIAVFGHDDLVRFHRGAGLEILEDWQPRNRTARCVIARKPER